MKLSRYSTDRSFVTDLELSHTELRAAVRLAGRRNRAAQLRRRNDPLLGIMRRVLRWTTRDCEGVGAATAAVANPPSVVRASPSR
jgi:hypothetical protein